MLEATIEWLAPRPGGRYCDATVGYGGHARALLERCAPDGRLIGIDQDKEAIVAATRNLAGFGDRVTLVHAPFSDVRRVLEDLGAIPVDGFLLDLGVSSPQLDRAERGFSFRQPGPLDMRMDQSRGETAADLLRRVSEVELETILREYGEERNARRLARAILEAQDRGELTSTAALAAIVSRRVPRNPEGRHPATRTFQALRIAVNRELEQLERFLEGAPACLGPGGRLVVLAFHSLEDRMVKHRFRELAAAPAAPADSPGTHLRILTKHVVKPDRDEQQRNPRSRSARLRAAERVP